jgi:small subunit ribosomal protein S2
MTKKELLVLRREKDKLERTLGGIRDMARPPAAIWVVDTNKEHIAVGEARKLGIPVIAILDSNCDPDLVDFPIPGNDDAIRAVGLLTRVIADAAAEGLVARVTGGVAAGTAEPMAEWEAELLATHEAELAAGSDVAAEAEAAPETEAPADADVTPGIEADAEVEPATEVEEPAAAAEVADEPAAS